MDNIAEAWAIVCYYAIRRTINLTEDLTDEKLIVLTHEMNRCWKISVLYELLRQLREPEVLIIGPENEEWIP